MFIGVGRYDLFIPASTSLKDKRQVLRSVTQTVRKKFSVAVAEVDHQELWQRAALGVSCLSDSLSHCRDVLDEVERTIGRVAAGNAEIVDREVQIVAMEDL
ncbi:MAG: uncharacterized protein QOH26_1713 [Actinomycetota bacterium]|jgi:uncharacterized protein YlxP (DUF503 family)|nr:uncharacterized protein [Actinomycetota bacterium]